MMGIHGLYQVTTAFCFQASADPTIESEFKGHETYTPAPFYHRLLINNRRQFLL
jgi:hypothetical protein